MIDNKRKLSVQIWSRKLETEMRLKDNTKDKVYIEEFSNNELELL